MATGGTIPTNRTQSVTFYNSSTVIERDKNIYYVPRFSKTGATTGQTVRQAWLNAFNSVCPPSSAYTDIEISSWSPQDRTLRVKGNIDDFRLVSEEGDCLNYFILTRNVTTVVNSVTKIETHYYAFFITGVEQAGGSSVELSIEPDDFTNVFYLHNKTTLTAGQDYEPFNAHMKNCYVNRQHYDRVDELAHFKFETTNFDFSSYFIDREIGQTIEIELWHWGTNPDEKYKIDSFYGVLVNFVLSNNGHSVEFNLKGGNALDFYEDEDTEAYIFQFEGGATPDLFTTDITNLDFEKIYIPTIINSKIFLNQEESFRYKYQYRDLKEDIYKYMNFSASERRQINSAISIASLSEELRKKVIYNSLLFLVVETRGLEIMSKYTKSTISWSGVVTEGNLIGSIHRPNVLISFPFLDTSKFPKFAKELEKITFYYSMLGVYSQTGNYNLSSANEIYKVLNQKAIADYVLGAYITKDYMFPIEKIRTIYNSTNHNYELYFNLDNPVKLSNTYLIPEFNRGYYLGAICYDKSQNSYIEFNYENNPPIVSLNNACAGIVISGYNSKDYKVPLKEKSVSSIKTGYYDPVLEAEPYSYYTISYNSAYELPFNKNRYFLNEYLYAPNGITCYVNVKYLSSINGGLKIGIIPSYNVEEYETKYYNEGLVFTLSSFLPLISDSYMSYYYQNQAQMKNQYAVAEYSFKTDMGQNFFVTSPNQVGRSAAFKGGGWAALAETGSQVMGWIDNAIDYEQQKKVIGMNQKAKLADMGAKPDTLKQAGSDIFYDIETQEFDIFINHYTIDTLSYESIAKMLERVGYQVNLYDTLHVIDRVGWNFVKLNNFDYDNIKITLAQENAIKKIFFDGVTLLHDKSYLTSGHNYETILEGGD